VSAYRGRRILVTGGAGFIGSWLVEDLVQRGARTTVLDSLATGHLENLAAVEGDIEVMHADLVHDDVGPLIGDGGFDTIFHLAAGANVAASVDGPRSDFERGVVGTFNLLEAVRQTSPGSAVVHVSSAMVYGTGGTLSEGDPKEPVSPYGAGKLAAETYVSLYACVYGLRTANLRLFGVYGPRQRKQVVYDLIDKLDRDPHELHIFGDGSQVRDFNHVANVVEALLSVAVAARMEGEAYNVAGDQPVSIGALAEMICVLMQASPRLVYSGHVRRGDSDILCGDSSFLKEIGYRPRLSLAEGLADTVAWFQREQSTRRARPRARAESRQASPAGG
jgi:UDP-glucose 4-epimerase